jgi:primosomal protein N'
MKQFRYEIFVRVDRSFNLQALLHDLQEQVRPPAQTRVAIDIDPLSF